MNVPKIANSIRIRLPKAIGDRLDLFLARRQEHRLNADFAASANVSLDHAIKNDFTSLFHFAEDHFGIVQNESEFKGLLDLLSRHAPLVGAEIGTCRCGSLFMLSHYLPTLKKMIAVDMIFRQSTKYRHYQRKDQNVIFIEGVSTSRFTQKTMAGVLQEKELDFLFIDGDHSFDGCLRDFLLYSKYVRENGFIIFHDIVEDMTTRHRSPVPLSKSIAGDVHRVWNILKNRYQHYEFIDTPNQDGRGIGVLKYSSTVDLSDL